MKKFILFLVVLVISIKSFADPMPPRPLNVPEKAKWEDYLWAYYNESENTLYTWYKNGALQRKGKFNNNQKPEGVWEYWTPDGKKMMIELYEHGELVRKENYLIFHPEGQRPLNLPKEARWNFDKKGWAFVDEKNNFLYVWYMNGEKMLEAGYANGRMDGRYVLWYQNGVVKNEGSFNKGKADEEWINRFGNGKIESIEFFKDGKAIWKRDPKKIPPKNIPKDAVWGYSLKGWCTYEDGKEILWHENGKTKLIRQLKDWKPHGKANAWYEDGTLAFEGQYEYSKREGKWIYYNPEGTVWKEVIYKDDQKVNGKIINN